MLKLKVDPSLLLNYSGFCRQCQKDHRLDYDLAIKPANELYNNLKNHGCLDFEFPIDQRQEIYSLKEILSEYGVMFGVLVCLDKEGNPVTLKAFSGKHNGHWSVDSWCPAAIDIIKYEETLERGNTLIHPLNSHIDLLESSKEFLDQEQLKTLQELILQRKEISREIRHQYLNSYPLKNFKGQSFGIIEAHLNPKKIHMGTGDCAAIKLLNHAAHKGYTPLSVCEFYMGVSSKDDKRHDGVIYGACQERCQPLLGQILCGLDR